MNPLEKKVREGFEQRFGEPAPIVVRAPGRVNLIGEHTDYNDGFVLPMAIDRALWIALRARSDRRVVPYSIDYEQGVTFTLDDFQHENTGWAEYVRGTAWALSENGYSLTGWEGVMASDIPIGAGLSSSAALELASARAFAAVSNFDWHPGKMAKLSQLAENEWVGVNSGIMDQMISAAGRKSHALLIDCRSLDTKSVHLPDETAVIIMDTATRRGLVDSAYNERRQQCEEASRFFGVPKLRDVTMNQYEQRADDLAPLTRHRALHVISENARTLEASRAAQTGDAIRFGQLMHQSHVSLRDDFEVSSKELNVMVEIAQEQAGCYGARMTGAGFGGCAVALIKLSNVTEFTTIVAETYHKATGIEPAIYVCHASNGAEQVT